MTLPFIKFKVSVSVLAFFAWAVLFGGSPGLGADQHSSYSSSGSFRIKQWGLNNDFDTKGDTFLPNQSVWSDLQNDGDIKFRKLMPNTTADFLFSPFDVNENGFCTKDMIVEVFYRDDLAQNRTNQALIERRPILQSRIDFINNKQYEEIGYLDTVGDRKWKKATIFIVYTPGQRIRAIDGSFQIRIKMPKAGNIPLPISYVKLSSLGHQEFVTIREEWRSRRGLQRLEYAPKGPLVPKNSAPQQPYAIYPVNSLELIFPNSEINYDNVGKALRCFEIPGQAEPVSFVIHAFKDINDFSVNVSDLVSENGTIGSEMISIRRVEYNDQRWGEGRTKKYGTAPDYLGYENPTVTIPAGKNCQLWLKIYVPPTARPATYEGKVKIKLNGQPVELPLSVEVLPVKLLPNRVAHMVWHSPFLKDYAPSPLEILKDMKEHGVVPIFYSTAQPVFGQNGNESTIYFVHQLESFRKVDPDARRILIVMRDHIDLWRNLKCPAPECSHPCSKFDFAYSRILKTYADLAESFGLDIYFSFEDEPFNDPHRRTIAYYCSSLAKSIGLKTWSTHNLKMDTRLETKEDISEVYLNPLRQVLDVFVEHIGRIDKNAIETFVNSPSNLSYYTTYLATGCWPVYNRLLHGIYPLVIKSEFVTIYAYRDSCVDPYDDMDAQAIDADNSGLPDYLLTYPSWNGQILPTLSYEALAEGIEDSHLISTLQQLVEKALNSNDPNIINLAKQTDNFLTNILNRVNSDFSKNYWRHPPGPIDPMEKKILRDLNNGESEDYGIFNKIRRDVCDKIIALQNVLGENRETDPSKLKNW